MARRLEIDLLNECTGLTCTMLAIHCAVFPLDRQWSLVIDIIEGTDYFFKANPTASHTAEVPVATGIAERRMTAEHTNLLRGIAPVNIFHMYVEDTVGELINKIDIINALIAHVTRIIVETEGWVIS